jgi:hypothetical protein
MTMTSTVKPSLEFDWDKTCEKCLGKLVKRRIIADGCEKIVAQCTRCRFFRVLDDCE